MSITSQSLTEQINQLIIQYQAIEHKNAVAARQEVQAYAQNLTALKEAYKKIKPAPQKPLTIPAIFSKQHDENFISDYIAYILNPRQNGLGKVPIEKLFEICGLDPLEYPLEQVTIHREFPLDGGRIDLLLEWEDSLVIGIENKIFSPEGSGQTQHYAKTIQKIFEEIPYHLIYLSRGGYIARSKNFQPLSYARLWQSLKEIPLPNHLLPRRRVLWEDFLEHLEVYIVSSQPEKFSFSDKAKLYMEHSSMIEDLRNTSKQEWKQFIDYIQKQLSEYLAGELWEYNFNSRYYWNQVYKPSWSRPGLSVHFEYFFSYHHWEKKNIAFMVDVEGKHDATFIPIFEQHLEGIKSEYEQHEIKYRPSNRKIAIAWKTYPIEQDIDNVVQVFIKAFSEFRFLEKEIDAALIEWQANQAKESEHV